MPVFAAGDIVVLALPPLDGLVVVVVVVVVVDLVVVVVVVVDGVVVVCGLVIRIANPDFEWYLSERNVTWKSPFTVRFALSSSLQYVLKPSDRESIMI